jgi:hypothetical protein
MAFTPASVSAACAVNRIEIKSPSTTATLCVKSTQEVPVSMVQVILVAPPFFSIVVPGGL